MNDPSSRPVEPPAARRDGLTETSNRAREATSSHPVPDSANRETVVGGPIPAGAATGDLHHIGTFAVVRKLGEGGMGAVYLAEDVKLRRRVAIKTMKPELAADPANRERFEREARAAAAVEHDNIVPILHIDEMPDGSPFIVMPFLHGEMLDSRLKRQAVAPLGLVCKVAREVAEGLAAAHAKGLIHRDIKPGNIWLEGESSAEESALQIRRCRILDFGLARSVQVNKDEIQITASGAILGTPAYMAPEQARGEKVDHRSDLFSLGATLYRMATGRLPFDGTTAMSVLIALATETPRPVREINPTFPPPLADLIDQLMSKDPSGRPQSAAEVAQTLRRIIKDLKAKQAPATPPIAPTSPEPPDPVIPVADLVSAPEPPSAPHPRAVPIADEGAGSEPTEPRFPERATRSRAIPVVDDGAESEPDSRHVKHKPPTKPKRSRLWWGIAAVIGLLSLGCCGFPLYWILDQAFSAPPPTNPGAERKAAERVFALGGTVKVNGGVVNFLHKKEELPQEDFCLTYIDLNDKPVTDADLAVFKDCTSLAFLYLEGTQITDAGLVHLTNCKNLLSLYLERTSVTEKGASDLANHLPKCTVYWGDKSITGSR
jgi:serine/threonine protein kinase